MIIKLTTHMNLEFEGKGPDATKIGHLQDLLNLLVSEYLSKNGENFVREFREELKPAFLNLAKDTSFRFLSYEEMIEILRNPR